MTFGQVNKGINKVNFPKKCKGPVEDKVSFGCSCGGCALWLLQFENITWSRWQMMKGASKGTCLCCNAPIKFLSNFTKCQPRINNRPFPEGREDFQNLKMHFFWHYPLIVVSHDREEMKSFKIIGFVMEFIRFQIKTWAKPLVLEYIDFMRFSVKNLKQTIGFPLEFMRLNLGNSNKTIGFRMEVMRFSVRSLRKTVGFTLELMRLNLRNWKKTVAFTMEFMRLNFFRNLSKTIDFALGFMRLKLRNSNKTIAFSLEFIGFNMRNLKKCIALTLEFIGFKMGHVKNRLVLHWNL